MKEDEFREVLMKLHGSVDENVVAHYVYTRRHLKEGSNKIEVRFEGDAFSDTEVEEINQSFEKEQYQFSYIDESRVAKAHFDYQEIIATIDINKETFDLIKNGLIYPSFWLLIIKLIEKVFAAKDKLEVKVKKKTVCIYVSTGKNNSIKFLMKGKFTFDEVHEAMDKAMQFAKTVDFSDGGFHYYEITQKGKIKRIE